MFVLHRLSPYARFLTAATVSLYGDQVTTIALLVLLYQVTGRIQAPAAYLLAKQIPRILGTAPGGALADRLSPQAVVSGCSVVQALAVASIIPAGRAGSAAAIYGCVVVAQLTGGMSRAAMGAVLPQVVPAAGLGRANAVLQLSQNTAFVLGPLLAAPLLGTRGPEVLLELDVASFVIAALLMAAVPSTVAAAPAAVLPPALFEGLRAVAANPLLRCLAATYVAEGAAVSLASAVFVTLAVERLGGAGAVGLLYAAVGVGDALGALLVLRLRRRRISAVEIVVPGAASVAVIALLALAHSWWSAALPLGACGLGAVVFQTWGMAEAQANTARELMGRVSGTLVVAQSSGLAAGAVLQLVLLSVTRWDVSVAAGSLAAAGLLLAFAVLGGGGSELAARPVGGERRVL